MMKHFQLFNDAPTFPGGHAIPFLLPASCFLLPAPCSLLLMRRRHTTLSLHRVLTENTRTAAVCVAPVLLLSISRTGSGNKSGEYKKPGI
ncbi:hypothetical protein EHW65_07150 [Erwinia psidii]|uniref:hypothetical protein n=1 Tax=Erwinia psidii TaxID=69224 RepID=UPI00226B2063|nr:hypothetical protein [Erwinia psidii]MCX8957060.1 hypothetical protein [Erwinia psidii]